MARNDMNELYVILAEEMLLFLKSINFALYVIIYMSESIFRYPNLN